MAIFVIVIDGEKSEKRTYKIVLSVSGTLPGGVLQDDAVSVRRILVVRDVNFILVVFISVDKEVIVVLGLIESLRDVYGAPLSIKIPTGPTVVLSFEGRINESTAATWDVLLP